MQHDLSRCGRPSERDDRTGEYNLASGNATSVRDFVLTLANVANSDKTLLRFGAIPMRPDDLPYVVADTTKLDKAIGVAGRTSLDQALMAALRDLTGRISLMLSDYGYGATAPAADLIVHTRPQ